MRCLISAYFLLIACTCFAAEPSASSTEVDTYNWRLDVANLNTPGGVLELPVPQITTTEPTKLSLREAILLSLRNNPDIQSTELDRITDKFALIVAHNIFEPQYRFSMSATTAQGEKPIYTTNAGVSMTNTIGTQFGMDFYDTYGADGSGGAQTAFTVKQPLLKGFGYDVNTASWFNALDSENQARLSFKSSMMSQVVAVVNSYRQLIEDYQNMTLQDHALKASAQMVKQAELKYQKGRLAHSDLLQQQANYETTQLSLLRQKSGLIADYQQFLQLLGLKAEAKIEIDKKLDTSEIKVPSIDTAVAQALKGNLNYQRMLLSIHAAERAVISAKDAARWQLDLTGSFNVSDQDSEPVFVTEDGVTTVQQFPVQGSPSATLSLSIPIDDVSSKQAIANAKIALQQAKFALESAKLSLVSQITNEVQQLQNQQLTLQSAERQVDFQTQSYEAAKIKYHYGQTTTFELNQIKDQLLEQQLALVSHRITLLNQITTLNQDLGLTLQQWDIHLRY